MQDTIKETNVLFQKLGSTWYAFAEVEGEMLFRALPEGLDPKTTKFEFTQVVDTEKTTSTNSEIAA